MGERRNTCFFDFTPLWVKKPMSFAHNFRKCKPIFEVIAQIESGENFQQDTIK